MVGFKVRAQKRYPRWKEATKHGMVCIHVSYQIYRSHYFNLLYLYAMMQVSDCLVIA
jgi:hypothetical protein